MNDTGYTDEQLVSLGNEYIEKLGREYRYTSINRIEKLANNIRVYFNKSNGDGTKYLFLSLLKRMESAKAMEIRNLNNRFSTIENVRKND